MVQNTLNVFDSFPERISLMIICIHHYTALISLYVIQTLEGIPFRSRNWNSPNGLTHDFNQELEKKTVPFLGKTGLGKVFGNVLHRKQAFLDCKNIDF